MHGPRFFMLARRLAAYAGVLAARVLAEHEAEGGQRAAPQRSSGRREEARRVSDAAALAELASLGMVER